jgi:7-cyano-7-deazaguanine synthase
MCGITGYWQKEAALEFKVLDKLFKGTEKRGQDGFGICFYRNDQYFILKSDKNYSQAENIKEILKQEYNFTITMGISRATPETEVPTYGITNQQPIQDGDFVICHNGSVSDYLVDELHKDFQFNTKIDSEAILHAYKKFNYNMKMTMEYLQGAFAFSMIDRRKNKLYLVNSYLPLSHMYIKGYGYFWHSDLETLEQIRYDITGATRDGMNVWEQWYCHELPPYTIVETDLESGFQNFIEFKPNFDCPSWNKDIENNKEKCLVIASGGMDSGLTAFILKECGYDVGMIHFSYGQKSEQGERWAVREISKYHNIPVRIIDLSNIYKNMNSMLIGDSEVTTGTRRGIKSTVAWVPGRNAVFSSIVAAIAENCIMSFGYKTVYIAAGFSQLSEETNSYPDNSSRFVNSLANMIQFGYIVGKRIQFMSVLQNLTKTESWYLADYLGFVHYLTCSCDDAIYETSSNKIYLCEDCGSTKLSVWAAKRAGVTDLRNFYKKGKVEDEKIVENLEPQNFDIENLIDRLQLPIGKRELLKFRI